MSNLPSDNAARHFQSLDLLATLVAVVQLDGTVVFLSLIHI